ncbi:MAG TPA: agmatinase, partial [Xanthomarina gelatinilytica]|nr:agmatinase [Xanthomarina gelatinilytica]
SMDVAETTVMDEEKVFFAHDMAKDEYWMDKVIEALGDNVFITFDLDALDPSILPSTGTPEPGGLFWYETLDFLKQVFDERNVVGFDIVELCPNPEERASDFVAAKLYYKMLTYKFAGTDEEDEYESNFNETKKGVSKFNTEEDEY